MKSNSTQCEKTHPEGTVFTLLKFELSNQDKQSYIGYVSQNTKTGRVNGVRADSHYPKKICIADVRLNYMIIPDVLYKVTLIPMKSGMGYVVIEAEPYQFKAHITTNYVPKALYQVIVSFGQKHIVFDPLNGKKPERKTISGVKELLSKRFDIINLNEVISEFELQAYNLLSYFIKDGYYVKKQHKAI